jgi:hypothetical protein
MARIAPTSTPLESFLVRAAQNREAVAHVLASEAEAARMLDSLFDEWLAGLESPEDPIAAGLAYRAHSALRAASQLLLSGQVVEAFPVIRTALESALYAQHMAFDVRVAQAWSQRSQSASAKKISKVEFSAARTFASLARRDPRVEAEAKLLYEKLIDFGAHPNPYATGANLSIVEEERGLRIEHTYLTNNHDVLRLGFAVLCKVSIIIIEIFRLILPARIGELDLVARAWTEFEILREYSDVT